MMVGLEFPQVIREGRIEEWALSQSKSAELLLLACCMTQTGTHQTESDTVRCLSTDCRSQSVSQSVASDVSLISSITSGETRTLGSGRELTRLVRVQVGHLLFPTIYIVYLPFR